MPESILYRKRVLAVDDEPDVLTVLEEEIMEVCPECKFDKATSYEEAVKKIVSRTYDLVILDIMGVRGFELLDLSVKNNVPVAMLTAHALTPDALKRSIQLMARVYLPKEKMGEIVPFLEYILKHEYLSGWKLLLRKLKGYFNERWGKNWQKSEEKFWKEFNKKLLTSNGS
jgi:DNA-binding response OmpR family regulator